MLKQMNPCPCPGPHPTIKFELGMERGGVHVQMTMTTTMRPGERNTQQLTASSGRTQRAIEWERDGGEGSRQ